MSKLPVKCFLVKQIRELEELAVLKQGLSEPLLMERAGQASYDLLIKQFPRIKSIAVVCGSGKNGGDGYVVARLAQLSGLSVKVYSLGLLDRLPLVALDACKACLKAGVDILPFTSDVLFDNDDLIVDAILGIGLQNEVHGLARQAIHAVNASDKPVLSIDLPSGLNADTGSILGACVRAHSTLTFIGLKPGLLTEEGLAHCGQLHCDDLGLQADFFEQVPVFAYRLGGLDLSKLLPTRKRNTHKGQCGYVLVVGGDYGMPGAVRMAAEAAARVGAGLVSVATRPEHISAVVASRPELMCHGIDKPEDLSPLLARASVLVVGSGLGLSNWSKALWQKILISQLPIVVDASALVLLAEQPIKRENWILTPHPGEAATLLSSTVPLVQSNRFLAANQLQQRYGGVVVLKGAGTIIQAINRNPEICDAGNPGMATAGMGDVLSGVLGGLLAQGLTIDDAASLGVYLHATAGDRAAKKGERGLLASDLIKELRALVNNQ